MHILKLFFPTLAVCCFIDMIWVGFLSKSLYTETIGHLLRKSNDVFVPNWPAAIVVYVLLVLGIILFALPKAAGNHLMAFFWGAVLGAVIYGVYDFTNYAILANWPLKITLIDFLWGITLCGSTTFIVSYIQNWLAS